MALFATQDGTFDGGQRLEQCTQGVLSELGYPYQARGIPHFRIVSPLRYVAPESGRVVVGGFNQYRAEDLQVSVSAIPPPLPRVGRCEA